MATETHYAFFKSVYDEENVRYTELESRAKFYLTIQTFYLGAIAFKFDDIRKFSEALSVPPILFITGGLLVVLGLLLTVLATRIRAYEAPTDLQKLLQSFGSSPPTDSEFLDDRLADLAVATDRNSIANDKVASLLTYAGILLFAAVTVHFVTFVYAYIHQLRL